MLLELKQSDTLYQESNDNKQFVKRLKKSINVFFSMLQSYVHQENYRKIMVSVSELSLTSNIPCREIEIKINNKKILTQ